jgi:cytochrome c oxidase subunit 2
MQINFQEPITVAMKNLISFHDWALTFIILICILVAYISVIIVNGAYINGLLKDDQELELIWTIIPFFILLCLAVPSLKILYRMEEVRKPFITLQAIGHQWYWTYHYFLPFEDSCNSIEVEGRYVLDNKATSDKIRQLETENRLTLPVVKDLRVLCTADDVLHAWGINSLGVKVDAVPGRINQLSFLINKPGVFYGNCMELCGAQHSFMPVTIESVNTRDFFSWLL